MDLIERIKAKENGFSKGQRKLADYILKEYDKAAFLTASKLGKEAGDDAGTFFLKKFVGAPFLLALYYFLAAQALFRIYSGFPN